MKKIRTLPQAAKEIKENDPQTAVTYNALRMWVTRGELPSVKAGNTYLIDMDVLYAFLGGDSVAQSR